VQTQRLSYKLRPGLAATACQQVCLFKQSLRNCNQDLLICHIFVLPVSTVFRRKAGQGGGSARQAQSKTGGQKPSHEPMINAWVDLASPLAKYKLNRIITTTVKEHLLNVLFHALLVLLFKLFFQSIERKSNSLPCYVTLCVPKPRNLSIFLFNL